MNLREKKPTEAGLCHPLVSQHPGSGVLQGAWMTPCIAGSPFCTCCASAPLFQATAFLSQFCCHWQNLEALGPNLLIALPLTVCFGLFCGQLTLTQAQPFPSSPFTQASFALGKLLSCQSHLWISMATAPSPPPASLHCSPPLHLPFARGICREAADGLGFQ